MVIVVDKIDYAGNPKSIEGLDWVGLVVGSTEDKDPMDALVKESDLVVNFAVGSHNDNSPVDLPPFIYSNLAGTFSTLEACRCRRVRPHHIPTDEVYEDLALDDPHKFEPDSPYRPSSLYSVSKAGSDMLVRAWIHPSSTEAITSNCSNNHGPYQHVEKLIPRMITNRMDGVRPHLYGDGLNVCNWIHVLDHNTAVWATVNKGRLGETYLIGANGEKNNLQVVQALNKMMGFPEDDLDQVKDHSGHNCRYAIDATKLCEETGWESKYTDFEEGLCHTIEWYQSNEAWWCPTKEATKAKYIRQGHQPTFRMSASRGESKVERCGE